MDSDMDDDKWLVKHRRCFQLMILAMFSYSFLSFIDSSQPAVSSLLKDVLLNIFSSLSMPLTICSGGACNSIYISTVTSILSSFSVPLAMVVPVLNIIGYLLQLVGLFSLYSANKWRSIPFWIYSRIASLGSGYMPLVRMEIISPPMSNLLNFIGTPL